MQLYFNGLILPVDERRQSTVLHMPVAISIRELRDTISQQLVEKFPDEEKDILSLEWIRYQFWPKNPHSLSALITPHWEVFYQVWCTNQTNAQRPC